MPSSRTLILSPTTREMILPFYSDVRIVGLSPEMNGKTAKTLPTLKRDSTGKVVGQNVLIRASEEDINGSIPMGLNFENMELLPDQFGGRRKRKTKANRKLKRRKSRKHKNKKKN
jgi:hypothetical protein